MKTIPNLTKAHYRQCCYNNDENPKTAQIQGPMTRSKTKQSMDALQQMVADILSKAQVEKDEAPE